MNIEEYWQKNTLLLQDGGQADQETIDIRKTIICRMLEIPFNEIQPYLLYYDYLRLFALKDSEKLSEDVLRDEVLLCKAEAELQRIYDDDYYELINILRKNQYGDDAFSERPKNDVSKKEIEQLVGYLLDLLNNHQLPDYYRETLETYNQVYRISISLINAYMRGNYTGHLEDYYEHLLYQWQTANELAEHVSQQRSSMNNFYMSLISILIAGILFSDNMMTSIGLLPRLLIYIIVSVIGAILCHIWRKQIDNYAKLNSIKYRIINEMERSLPANVLYYEYKLSERKSHKDQRKINFSQHERIIAIMFEVVIIIIPLILIIHLLGWTKEFDIIIIKTLAK